MDSALRAINGRPPVNKAVMVFNSNGRFLKTYPSIEDTAKEFQADTTTIRNYINNGKLWKSKKVFLDLAL